MHSWQKRGMSSQPVGRGLLGVWGRYFFLTSLTEPRIFFWTSNGRARTAIGADGFLQRGPAIRY